MTTVNIDKKVREGAPIMTTAVNAALFAFGLVAGFYILGPFFLWVERIWEGKESK